MAELLLAVVTPLAIGLGFICLGVSGIKSLFVKATQKKEPEPQVMVLRDPDGNLTTYEVMHKSR